MFELSPAGCIVWELRTSQISSIKACTCRWCWYSCKPILYVCVYASLVDDMEQHFKLHLQGGMARFYKSSLRPQRQSLMWKVRSCTLSGIWIQWFVSRDLWIGGDYGSVLCAVAANGSLKVVKLLLTAKADVLYADEWPASIGCSWYNLRQYRVLITRMG
jgi:hypothetical protein